MVEVSLSFHQVTWEQKNGKIMMLRQNNCCIVIKEGEVYQSDYHPEILCACFRPNASPLQQSLMFHCCRWVCLSNAWH